jgi:hypothetical protein
MVPPMYSQKGPSLAYSDINVCIPIKIFHGYTLYISQNFLFIKYCSRTCFIVYLQYSRNSPPLISTAVTTANVGINNFICDV